MIIERKIHIQTLQHGRKKLCSGEISNISEIKSKPNRNREMLIFAMVFDSWLEQEKVSDLSEIARVVGLSRFMVSKIMKQRLLPISSQIQILKAI